MTPAQIRKAKNLVEKYESKLNELRNVYSPTTGVLVAVFDRNGKDIQFKLSWMQITTIQHIGKQHKKFLQFLRKTGGAA